VHARKAFFKLLNNVVSVGRQAESGASSRRDIRFVM
jgi:hypothetical protein